MSNERVTGWVGWIWFAGIMMIVDGIINTIHGLTAIFSSGFFIGARGLVLNVTGWGWVHLIIGVLLLVVGTALAVGKEWARVIGIVLVALNLVTQMMSIPIYPWWSLLAIVIDGLILYALIVHGDEARTLREGF